MAELSSPRAAKGSLQQQLAEQGIHTIIAQFTDIHGVAKGKLVPLAHLPMVLGSGAGFSGPSIDGTGLPRMGPRSEYYGRGDPQSALALPWMPGYARIVCDGFVGGEPFEACPRQVLRRQLKRLQSRGWTLQVGIEPEFFLFGAAALPGSLLAADAHDRLDKPSYDLKSLLRQQPFLLELADALAACGLDVFQIDHEDSHGQYEVNFGHKEALASADALMLFKFAAHALAEQRELRFSMMPKPFANQPGSGMHMHVSLWQGEHNLFGQASPAAQTEGIQRHFLAGVLAHSAALCALAAPTVNSYKRLVVGESLSGTTWAPPFVAHGSNNRTCLVRTLSDRFEWRLPDAAANPYLAIAGLIAAGLDGVEREVSLPPACDSDLFVNTASERESLGIATLPQTLVDALNALRGDAVLQRGLGAEICAAFLALKESEWRDYSLHVSDWERQRYLERF